MRLASAVDQPEDEHERALRRIALPLAKFWVCKRTPDATWPRPWNASAATAMSRTQGCRGCFRESPLNSIWEGSGNINALDVLRALRTTPQCLDAWLVEVGKVRGENRYLDAAVHDVFAGLADVTQADASARRLAARMAVCLQGALLLAGDCAEVAVATVHHSLGHVHARAGHVHPFVYIHHTTDRPAANAYPDLQALIVLQRPADL